jgi:hypothetical protein
MLINLNGTWYHYCGITEPTVTSLAKAEPSEKYSDAVGKYYDENVKGQFDCRVNPAPHY